MAESGEDGPPMTSGVVRPDDPLFTHLVGSRPTRRRVGRSEIVSFLGHTLVLSAVILVPLFLPEDMPEQPDYIHALIYDPPPPPPPPEMLGSSLADRQRPEPTTPKPNPDAPKPSFVAPITTPPRIDQGENKADASRQMGSETGSEFGVPEGMEGGVVGGVVGGVPGGVIGGVIGGTGDGPPVVDYDEPPRLIKKLQPVYPDDAFVKKIEGTVYLEVTIDSTGRVVRPRVVKSIPALDRAALQCALQWIFVPAKKQGRPVATVANIPVTFRVL